jgi:hypothetical protein
LEGLRGVFRAHREPYQIAQDHGVQDQQVIEIKSWDQRRDRLHPDQAQRGNFSFNLISELYEKSSIIITSNKSFDSWAEMMGDNILTTALLDRLFHHARVFTLDGESYRLSGREGRT